MNVKTTARALTVGLTLSLILPLFGATRATAQFQQQRDRDREYQDEYPSPRNERRRSDAVVPEGTLISVRHSEAETIIVSPEETLPVTLEVREDITSRRGTILIPEGSEIIGEIEPYRDGSRFVAEEIILRNRESIDLYATSETVTERQEIEEGVDLGGVLEKALIGAAAAAILADITGDIDLREVLVGAGLGAIVGVIVDRNTAEVIVIDPNRDLDLTLQSDLVLR